MADRTKTSSVQDLEGSNPGPPSLRPQSAEGIPELWLSNTIKGLFSLKKILIYQLIVLLT